MNLQDIRDEFQRYVEGGMTYFEASQMFDEQELQDAVRAELDFGTPTEDENSLFNLCVKASYEERQKRDFEEQAIPLMMAGWTMETANPTNSKEFWAQTQIMSLYWRAPSKRPGKPGRLYRSTNQAFNAMQKAQHSTP